MRAVVQRVSWASVDAEGERTGEIGKGFMVLLGVMEITVGEVRARLTETNDPVFPFFLSAIRPVGMIALRAEDIRQINTL